MILVSSRTGKATDSRARATTSEAAYGTSETASEGGAVWDDGCWGDYCDLVGLVFVLWADACEDCGCGVED